MSSVTPPKERWSTPLTLDGAPSSLPVRSAGTQDRSAVSSSGDTVEHEDGRRVSPFYKGTDSQLDGTAYTMLSKDAETCPQELFSSMGITEHNKEFVAGLSKSKSASALKDLTTPSKKRLDAIWKKTVETSKTYNVAGTAIAATVTLSSNQFGKVRSRNFFSRSMRPILWHSLTGFVCAVLAVMTMITGGLAVTAFVPIETMARIIKFYTYDKPKEEATLKAFKQKAVELIDATEARFMDACDNRHLPKGIRKYAEVPGGTEGANKYFQDQRTMSNKVNAFAQAFLDHFLHIGAPLSEFDDYVNAAIEHIKIEGDERADGWLNKIKGIDSKMFKIRILTTKDAVRKRIAKMVSKDQDNTIKERWLSNKIGSFASRYAGDALEDLTPKLFEKTCTDLAQQSDSNYTAEEIARHMRNALLTLNGDSAFLRIIQSLNDNIDLYSSMDKEGCALRETMARKLLAEAAFDTGAANILVTRKLQTKVQALDKQVAFFTSLQRGEFHERTRASSESA